MSAAEDSVSSIYIAAPEGDTGKSTVALGLLQTLCASTARVGVFRPIARSDSDTDHILELLLEHTTADLGYDDCVGVTYEEVHADPEAALGDIVTKYHAVADRCDAVVIVGSDFTEIASPSELAYNARIAANLGAPVLLVLRGARRTPDEIAQLADLCASELRLHHAHLARDRREPVSHRRRSRRSLPHWPAGRNRHGPCRKCRFSNAPTMAELHGPRSGARSTAATPNCCSGKHCASWSAA